MKTCIAAERDWAAMATPALPTGLPLNTGATVAERLARSPLTKANRVQSPAGSPDFPKWESCRTMPLVGGCRSSSPSFQRRPIFSSITLIGSQDLAPIRASKGFAHSAEQPHSTAQLSYVGRASQSGRAFHTNMLTSALALPQSQFLTQIKAEITVKCVPTLQYFCAYQRLRCPWKSTTNPRFWRRMAINLVGVRIRIGNPQTITNLLSKFVLQAHCRADHPSRNVIGIVLVETWLTLPFTSGFSRGAPVCPVVAILLRSVYGCHPEWRTLMGHELESPRSSLTAFCLCQYGTWKFPSGESVVEIYGRLLTSRSLKPMRLKGSEFGAAPEYKDGGKRETPEKTRRPSASSNTIATCDNPGAYPAWNRTRFALERGEFLPRRVWRSMLVRGSPPGSVVGCPGSASGTPLTPSRPRRLGSQLEGSARVDFVALWSATWSCLLGWGGGAALVSYRAPYLLPPLPFRPPCLAAVEVGCTPRISSPLVARSILGRCGTIHRNVPQFAGAAMLASAQGYPGFDSWRGRSPGFSHVGIISGDAAVRRVFSEISRPLPPTIAFPALSRDRFPSSSSALKTSVLRSAKISSFHLKALSLTYAVESQLRVFKSNPKSHTKVSPSNVFFGAANESTALLPYTPLGPFVWHTARRAWTKCRGEESMKRLGRLFRANRREDGVVLLKCKGGGKGEPRENPPASCIVQHDSHVRKSGVIPAGYRTRIDVVGGNRPNHCATAALLQL
ncbi:hypothetical protein PR048_028657 [Dryococelus australis]|uniref:Uncharacterized protein n=1 Tax=Dryococelus australis TaxID=614101 RepID=A0ABQ9GB72_9NEOP|nr:hypothetical protein PR048_028657 [Dryococelus australis]